MTAITLETPLSVGPFEIVTVVKSSVDADWRHGVLVATALKRPIAVLVRSPDALWTVVLDDRD